MKATIEVSNRKEAGLVKAAMEDPVMRATVLVVGALLSLPNDRARQRVLQYVKDELDEKGENHASGLP